MPRVTVGALRASEVQALGLWVESGHGLVASLTLAVLHLA